MAETPAVPVGERAQAPAGAAFGSDVFFSPLAMPPPRSVLRRSYAAVVIIVLIFAAVAPFTRVQLPAYPPFVLIFGVAIALNKAYTAVLLLSQYSALRRRALLVLASGYLFVAFILIPFMFSFPGVVTPGVQLAPRTEAAAWLYHIWHTVFPLSLIGYVLLRGCPAALHSERGSAWPPVLATIAIVTGFVIVMTVLATNRVMPLPPLVVSNQFTTLDFAITSGEVLLGLAAFGLIWRGRSRSMLDAWLLIVAAAWLASMGVSVLSGGRFSVGWYGSRVFELAAASILLILLLSETGVLYTRYARSAALERDKRERNLLAAQERLAHLARLSELRHVVTGLTHELHDRLSVVTRFLAAGGAAVDAGDISNLKAEYAKAAEQMARARKVLDRLYDVARTGEVTFRNEDLADTIEEVATLALARAGRPVIQFEIHLQPHCTWASIDRPGIQEVLFCLVNNALEATRDRRRRSIVIGAVPADNDMIEVCVADSGPGVAPEIRDRMFEPFVTTKPDTVGVGLSVSRAIVEQHGGRLWLAKSDAGGATFCFTVPRGNEDASAAADNGLDVSSAARVRIVSSAD